MSLPTYQKISSIDDEEQDIGLSQQIISHPLSDTNQDLETTPILPPSTAIEQDDEIDSAFPLPEVVIAPVNNETNNPNEEEKPEVSPSIVVGTGNDGVFANLSAKPTYERVSPATDMEPVSEPPQEWGGETTLEGQLPGYSEVVQEPSPPCFDDSVSHPRSLAGVSIDDLLVEGMPVGGLVSFMWSVLVSVMFRYVGFILTYLLHINHAGRLGSIVGLGLTFNNFGLKMRHDILYPNEEDDEFQQLPESSIWLAYLFMVFGWVIIIKSVSEFVRLRKQQSDLLESPETGITQ